MGNCSILVGRDLSNASARNWFPVIAVLTLFSCIKTLSCATSYTKKPCVCMVICVWLFVTLWTVARQAPLNFPGKGTEAVAISTSGGSSQPRDGAWVSCISCIGKWLLYPCTTWEAKNVILIHLYPRWHSEGSELRCPSSVSWRLNKSMNVEKSQTKCVWVVRELT